MRIAIIGGGITGIAAAKVLSNAGHQAVIFERAESLGGVWAVAYPKVRLQNIAEQYRLADFPWPFAPDLHPSREQILKYLQAALEHFKLELRLGHQVLALREAPDGWWVDWRCGTQEQSERFDFTVVASGQYTGEPQQLALAERERFGGAILSDRDVKDLDVLRREQIAVVGFGKSAVDMATLAAERGTQVHHVFRTPRWLLPRLMFGLHANRQIALFSLTEKAPKRRPGNAWERNRIPPGARSLECGPQLSRVWAMPWAG